MVFQLQPDSTEHSHMYVWGFNRNIAHSLSTVASLCSSSLQWKLRKNSTFQVSAQPIKSCQCKYAFCLTSNSKMGPGKRQKDAAGESDVFIWLRTLYLNCSLVASCSTNSSIHTNLSWAQASLKAGKLAMSCVPDGKLWLVAVFVCIQSRHDQWQACSYAWVITNCYDLNRIWCSSM